MSETPIVNWPFPVSSDLIADGAVNIEQLAESVEGQFFLAPAALGIDDPHSAYPVGVSIMAASSNDGWPSSGLVQSIRSTNKTWTTQYFCPQTASSEKQQLLVRFGYNVSGVPTWSKWDTVAGPGSPEAMASGNVTVTPKAGEPTSVAVSFPSGRFQYAPAVFTQYRGGSPGVGTSPASVTATGFTLSVIRDTATSTYVYWQAVSNQGE